MKTKISFFLLLSLATGLLMTRCNKDESKQQTEVLKPDAQQLIEKITTFRNKAEIVRANPHLKSGELMEREEARWSIETLFNVSYAFPEETYGKTVTDTSIVFLPVNTLGQACIEDVVTLYDQILAQVTQFYLGHNFEAKGFLLLQLKTGETHDNKLEVIVVAVTGEKRDRITDPEINYGPFYEGDNWFFGYGWGKCDRTISGNDAAEVLQETIHTSMIAWPEPPQGFRWVTANPFEIELIGNEYMQNGAYLTFYVENYTEADLCLDFTEMNFHYYGEEQVIYNRVPQFHPNFPAFNTVEDWVFLNCDFEGKEDAKLPNTPRIRHKNVLKYAQRFLVPVSEIPLPVELSNEQ